MEIFKFLPTESSILTDDYDEDDYIDSGYIGKFTASEVAALINKHEHRTLAQALYKLLKKSIIFSNILNEIKHEMKDKTEIIVNKCVKDASKELKNIIDTVSDNSEAKEINDIDSFIDTQIALAMSNLNLNKTIISDDLTIRIKKEFKSRVQMARGVKLEHLSIEQLQLELNINITKRNTKLYKFESRDLYTLSGKVDGIDEDKKCVIEIKNRIKYMEQVPYYDIIQCIVYMKLTDLKQCLLVECFPDKTTRKTTIEWNQDKFDSINDELCKLVCKIRKLTRREISELIKQYNIDCCA